MTEPTCKRWWRGVLYIEDLEYTSDIKLLSNNVLSITVTNKIYYRKYSMTTSFDEMIQKTSQLIPWVIRPNLKHAALIKHLPNLITLYHDDTNNGAQRIWYKQTDQEIAAQQQQQQQQQFNSSTNKLQKNVSRKRSRAEITPRTPRTRFRSPSIRTNLMNKPIVRKESRWVSKAKERHANGAL